MTTDSPEQTLRLDDAALIDALRGEFERDWRAGAAPRIEEFISRIGETLRPSAFAELLKAEVRSLRARGDRVTADVYLSRFPQLASAIREVFLVLEDSRGTVVYAPDKTLVGLHVRCPHCHNSIELAPEAELGSLRCSSCGNNFSLTDDADETRDARTYAQVGHFKLVERLGMGAFGTVWKARDLELDRTVAIKIPRAGQLDKKRQDFFFREARSAAQLRHPNIVPVYEVGRDGETLYIVSELVRGITLFDRLTAGPLPAREVAELCSKIANALHHAHEQGVIHRDLKPANIMIDSVGEPHLMDFGLARREAHEVTMTLDGQVLGTPAYMSPEQAQGESHIADRRSDVYSLGVILFELLTGELPFRGNTRMMIHQVIHDEAPNPRKLNSSIERDLDTITVKCMQKAPVRRYQTANDVALELDRYRRGEPIAARPVGAVERRLRWCKRNPLVASLVATAIGLLAGVAIVATIGYTQTSRALAQKNEAAATSDEVSKFLEGLFLTATPIVSSDAYGVAVALRNVGETNLTARQLLDRGSERINKELSDQPRVQAKLLTSMGNAYQGLGVFEKAAELFRQALAIERSLEPANPLEVANAIHRLAVTSGYAGNYKESEALILEARALLETLGDEGLMPLTGVKQSLGMLYMALNRFSEAEALLREVVETRERLRGPNDASVVHALQALAGLQLTTGHEEEANGTIVQMLECSSLNQDGSWDRAADIVGDYQRGLNARDRGRFSEAAVMLKSTVDEASRLLGARHPFVAIIMFEYAVAVHGMGDDATAIQISEQAIEIGQSLVSPTHPLLLFARANLVSAYIGAEQLDKADRMLEAMRPEVLAAWGEHSWQYAEHLATKAIVRFNAGDDAEAIALAQNALEITDALEPSQHHTSGIFTISLWQEAADDLIAADNLDAAQRAIAYAQSVAAKNPSLSYWIERLNVTQAALLIKQRRVEEAVALLREASASLRTQLGRDHDATLEAEEQLREAERLLPSTPAN